MASKLEQHEQQDFQQKITLQKTVKRGRNLAIQGSSGHYIYLIKSGAFKASVLSVDGDEQVIGFRHAGDVIGLDGLFKERQPSNAVALNDSIVCSVSVHDIKQLHDRFDVFRSQLLDRLQNEISELSQLLIMLNQMNSVERVITFILELSNRSANIGMSAEHLHLAMSRTEIGSYLGLKIETVSRKLTELSQLGLITVDHRSIKIEKLSELKRHQVRSLGRSEPLRM